MVNTTTSKNKDWSNGSIVKIGFCTLRVVDCRSEKDFLPDIYTLESIDGSKKYEFTPHNGLKKIQQHENIFA